MLAAATRHHPVSMERLVLVLVVFLAVIRRHQVSMVRLVLVDFLAVIRHHRVNMERLVLVLVPIRRLQVSTAHHRASMEHLVDTQEELVDMMINP